MPNLISLFRILIVPFFFSALLYYRPEKDFLRNWAVGLFIVGTLSDALDGFVARIRNESTELGRLLDPLADKLLLISGFAGLFLAHEFPLLPPRWVLVVIVFRDIVIVGGLLVLSFSGSAPEVRPNFLGKLTTAFQMATLIAILFLWPVSPFFWNTTACLTVLSGLTYIGREINRLRTAQ